MFARLAEGNVLLNLVLSTCMLGKLYLRDEGGQCDSLGVDGQVQLGLPAHRAVPGGSQGWVAYNMRFGLGRRLR